MLTFNLSFQNELRAMVKLEHDMLDLKNKLPGSAVVLPPQALI